MRRRRFNWWADSAPLLAAGSATRAAFQSRGPSGRTIPAASVRRRNFLQLRSRLQECPAKAEYLRQWKIARYAVDGSNVVGIGTFPDHANLFFYRGRELDDGSGLLQGAGKEMRSITLRAPADAERPAVKRMVRSAFKLGGTPARALKSSG